MLGLVILVVSAGASMLASVVVHMLGAATVLLALWTLITTHAGH